MGLNLLLKSNYIISFGLLKDQSMQNQQESCDILHTDWKENKEESGIWNILLKKLRFVAPTGPFEQWKITTNFIYYFL